jgi:hypothetical protein
MGGAGSAQAAPAVVQAAVAPAVEDAEEEEQPHGEGHPAPPGPDADEPPQGICTALSIDLPTGTQTIHLVRMQDRSRGERVSTYVIQAQLEKALYGTEASNGAVVTVPPESPASPLWRSLTASSPPLPPTVQASATQRPFGRDSADHESPSGSGCVPVDIGLPLHVQPPLTHLSSVYCRSGHAGRV